MMEDKLNILSIVWYSPETILCTSDIITRSWTTEATSTKNLCMQPWCRTYRTATGTHMTATWTHRTTTGTPRHTGHTGHTATGKMSRKMTRLTGVSNGLVI